MRTLCASVFYGGIVFGQTAQFSPLWCTHWVSLEAEVARPYFGSVVNLATRGGGGKKELLGYSVQQQSNRPVT
jgi:hypothetical protein